MLEEHLVFVRPVQPCHCLCDQIRKRPENWTVTSDASGTVMCEAGELLMTHADYPSPSFTELVVFEFSFSSFP